MLPPYLLVVGLVMMIHILETSMPNYCIYLYQGMKPPPLKKPEFYMQDRQGILNMQERLLPHARSQTFSRGVDQQFTEEKGMDRKWILPITGF